MKKKCLQDFHNGCSMNVISLPTSSSVSLARLRQLGPVTDDNLLIFRDRTPKGRHYTEGPGAPRRGFKTAASARAASAMPSRADAGVVRGPRSAGYGAPAGVLIGVAPQSMAATVAK